VKDTQAEEFYLGDTGVAACFSKVVYRPLHLSGTLPSS
jgi:hypothetical protein